MTGEARTPRGEDLTRIVEQFIRARDEGQVDSLEEFCARYPESQREAVRRGCEQVLQLEGLFGTGTEQAPLTPGQTLSHYEIVGALGKGGMGEVYRARDTKLNREVALKVLPPDMAVQPERVKRFEREARAVAALDHPNIVTIHAVEKVGGLHFLTMQLVEGKMLSERIPRNGLALDKIFELAIPMADAVSAAHEKGITHRDLKPANIMVTPEGRVKILDFGLAKLREPADDQGVTRTASEKLTGEGRIVGTIAYMSPEQVEGKAVDHRSDIFAIGVILYQMVTGQYPFKGESSASLMSAILKDEPTPVTELNRSLPRHLGRIVRRCLVKDVRRRYQTASDVRNELAELKGEIDSGETEVLPAHRAGGRRWVWPAVTAGLLVVLLLVLLAPELFLGREDRGPIVTPTKLTDRAGLQGWPSLSSDGRALLYNDRAAGNIDVYRQRTFLPASRNLTEDNLRNDYHAAFDPSGDWIAYRSTRQDGGGIFVMGFEGKDPTQIVDGGFNPDWSPDGEQLVYGTVNTGNPHSRNANVGSGELRVVNVATREDRALYADGEIDAFHPSWSPNHKRIAFAGRIGGQRDIWTISVQGGEPVPVTEDLPTDWDPFWSPDGRYLYFLSDRGDEGKPDLWRVAIDEDSGSRNGGPEEVWAPVIGRVMHASMSGENIVCSLERVDSRILKIGFDPEAGDVVGEDEEIHYTGNHDLWSLSLSPTGEWLAFGSRRGVEDMFVVRYDGSSQSPRNLTHSPENDRNPNWYPVPVDGHEWLTFHSARGGSWYRIWRVRPSGIGLQPLALVEGASLLEPRWLDGLSLDVSREVSVIDNLQERVVFDFPDGLDGPAVGPREPRFDVGTGTSWSPNRQLFARRNGNAMTVLSMDSRPGFPHSVQDAGGRPYQTWFQHGNRWLDDRRLIFWDLDLERAFLWDVDSQTASAIDGITEPGEFAFSRTGDTLFMLRKNLSSDIYLLTLSN